MKEIKQYQALDGKIFDNADDCKAYEKELKENTINEFKKLIFRKANGGDIEKKVNLFPFYGLFDGQIYATIVLKNEKDFETVKTFSEIVHGDTERLEKIYNKEIVVDIGDSLYNEPEYNFIFVYGTIEQAIENYKKALFSF